MFYSMFFRLRWKLLAVSIIIALWFLFVGLVPIEVSQFFVYGMFGWHVLGGLWSNWLADRLEMRYGSR